MREAYYTIPERNCTHTTSRCHEKHRNAAGSGRTSRRGHHSRLYTSVLFAVIVMCSIIIIGSKSVSSASDEPVCQVGYTSVEIHQGDSLWSIASEYYTEDWKDVETYMETIKEYNGIASDVIYAGNYLSIPYIK